MKKTDLRAGMILETKHENKYLLLPYSGENTDLYAHDITNGTMLNLCKWRDDLTVIFGLDDDVEKIYAIESFSELLFRDFENEPVVGKLIWDRATYNPHKEELQKLIQQLQSIVDGM